MPLTGEAKKLYQREYMRGERSNSRGEKREAGRLLRKALRKGQVIKAERCEACGSTEYMVAHHPDYDKPLEVLWVCSSCHKKLHLSIAGEARKGSRPYINPLDKIARRREKVQPETVEVVERWTPTEHIISVEGVTIRRGHFYGQSPVVDIDADGNEIPDYE